MTKLANDVELRLAADVLAADTSITVETPAAPLNAPPVPAAGESSVLTLSDNLAAPTKIEIVRYTTVTDNADGTLTIGGLTRAQEGTAAQGFLASDLVYQAATAGIFNEKLDAAEKGQPDGLATLDAARLIPTDQLPGLAITDTFPVADIAARDALPIGTAPGEVQEGDLAIVADASADPDIPEGGATYTWTGTAWLRISFPVDAVQSVNGKVGAVSLEVTDLPGITDSGPQIQTSVDDVQAAKAADATDTTAGRLLKAGDHPMVLTPDPYRASVEAQTGGRLTVLYDDVGNASVMHVLPRFRYEDLGFSTEMGTGTALAFDRGAGSMRSEIFIGAYQAVSVGGLACSLPHQNPWTSVSFDNAKSACTSKGTGWHLMTMHEWAAVALWCMANGFEPRGNTNHGRAHDAPHEVGTRQDGDTWPPGDGSGIGNILTGSGPATWRHDGAVSGIADLVGNVWEWQDGFKLVESEIFANPGNDHTLAEANWPSASRWVLNSINPGDPTLSDAAGTPAGDSQSVTWASTPLSAGYVSSQLLRRLLAEPAGIAPQGGFWARDFDERVPIRGGGRNNGGSAGLAALNLTVGRGGALSIIGFRPAFVI